MLAGREVMLQRGHTDPLQSNPTMARTGVSV